MACEAETGLSLQVAAEGRMPFRRFWRFVLISLVGLLIVLALLGGWWWYEQVPDIGEPFDTQSVLVSSISEEENGIELYRQAAAAYVDAWPIPPAEYTDERSAAAWDSMESANRGDFDAINDDVHRWLDQNRTALTLWKKATERPRVFAAPPQIETFGTSHDITSFIRQISRPALAEAARLAAAGEMRTSWNWYAAVLRSARHSCMQEGMIGRFTGYATSEFACEPILHWAAHSRTTADDLENALHQAISIGEMSAPLSHSLKLDYFFDLECATNPDALTEFSPTWSKYGDLMRRLGEQERGRRLLNLIYANRLSQIDLPIWQQTPARSGELGLYELAPGDSSDVRLYQPNRIEKWWKGGFASRELIAEIFDIERLEIYVESAARSDTEYRSLIIALAAQLYARKNGKFPASLEDLTRGTLKQVPLDPFGQGEPLRYRLESDQTATVWSVGPDRIDNGGLDMDWNLETGDLATRVSRATQPPE